MPKIQIIKSTPLYQGNLHCELCPCLASDRYELIYNDLLTVNIDLCMRCGGLARTGNRDVLRAKNQ